MFGDFAPALVGFTDDVLFGQVWERQELSPRDRSLVTVASLVTSGNTDQLVFHLGLAKQNGLTEQETDRGPHPPGVLRGMAEGHVRDGGSEAESSAPASRVPRPAGGAPAADPAAQPLVR